LADLKVHINTFIDAGGRLAQNNYQLYLCLSASLDASTKEIMTAACSFYLAGVTNTIILRHLRQFTAFYGILSTAFYLRHFIYGILRHFIYGNRAIFIDRYCLRCFPS
jgi:uncharacterized membrane protein (DUF2068 family)